MLADAELKRQSLLSASRAEVEVATGHATGLASKATQEAKQVLAAAGAGRVGGRKGVHCAGVLVCCRRGEIQNWWHTHLNVANVTSGRLWHLFRGAAERAARGGHNRSLHQQAVRRRRALRPGVAPAGQRLPLLPHARALLQSGRTRSPARCFVTPTASCPRARARQVPRSARHLRY